MTTRTLVELNAGLWAIEDHAGIPGGAQLPVRATVISLGDGTLAIHSPVAMDEATAVAVESLGTVRHIIAPSALHHLYVGPALKRFSQAKLYGTRALGKKRKRLRFDAYLNDGLPAALGSVLEALTLQGAPAVEETVFFHKPSKSLLVTDMIFNIAHPQGAMTKFMLSCTGTNGKLAQSRLWRFYAKDKQAFVASTHKMLDWNFDALVPCHGDVVAAGAKPAVQAALRWK